MVIERKTILFIGLFAVCSYCYSQEKFIGLERKFNSAALPLDNMLTLPGSDTLNAKEVNDLLIRGQKSKPRFIDKNGRFQTTKKYFGLYPEKPFGYGYRGKQLFFYPKVIPIARINLNTKYVSLIVKVIDYETTFFDLWNFTKEGEALSVVCLFWGIRDAGPREEKVTFTIVNSGIAKDGAIVWHENDDGLETFRTYRLDENGFFKIVKEQQKGKSED